MDGRSWTTFHAAYPAMPQPSTITNWGRGPTNSVVALFDEASECLACLPETGVDAFDL